MSITTDYLVYYKKIINKINMGNISVLYNYNISYCWNSNKSHTNKIQE